MLLASSLQHKIYTIVLVKLSEISIINDFFTRHNTKNVDKEIVLGIGDDCALISTKSISKKLLAVSADMLVEGQHFLADIAPDALGHKALAVNLSDLAAMGAKPRFFMLACSLPYADKTWLAAFTDGLFSLAERYNCSLIGGDITNGPMNLCVTVFGEVEQDRALRRDAARDGDDIWVSGILGNARAGLGAIRGEWETGEKEASTFKFALDRPEPRVKLGLALAGLAHAAIDLSDGLVSDLIHILDRSGVSAIINIDAVPCSTALKTLTKDIQLQCMLAGGDDYELCFSTPRNARKAVEEIGMKENVILTRIGTICSIDVSSEKSEVIWLSNGEPISITLQGFDHFCTD
ncbi:MAG: thiamine-phosphate kinase [Burkholderia sp.]|nr:thiamine-phosphate kinase [Burkholderia sp.]